MNSVSRVQGPKENNYTGHTMLVDNSGLASWVFTQGKIPRYLPGKKGEKDFEVFPP